ncbi:hypothetical protein TAL182_CH01076 [Rhizobium sp. TAL182]|uniref:hypothetical protein n=1 Tax=Rhizobium sp. TAL182 TaxID=2020313 RepID=UPI000A20F708|nr:hypothetical protein [Rhizobium sp. TAL182]ARO22889.1 hypothetical protein TAL182_CH01076 [Rhizobium sp. TAL182]
MRLGIRQLELLRTIGTTSALVVSNPVSRRLCELGLMQSSDRDGSFAYVTPAGLRALADAAEAGRVTLFVMPKVGRTPRD